MKPVRILAIALAAGSALAQTAPSLAGPSTQPVPPSPPSAVFRMHGMFAGLSPEGQAILREAMRDRRAPKDIEALRAARQRVLALIARDQLDIAAVRRAQAEERRIVMEGHARQQEAMLKVYARLSAADRKAFVEGMTRRETRMEDHVRAMRERMERLNRMEREFHERVNQRLREQGLNQRVREQSLPPEKGKAI